MLLRQLVYHDEVSSSPAETSGALLSSLLKPGDYHQLGEIIPRADQYSLLYRNTDRCYLGEGLSNEPSITRF